MKWSDMEKYDSTDMKKHILEQGEAVKKTLSKNSSGSDAVAQSLSQAKKIVVSGAGDKYIVPLISEYIWRKHSDVPMQVLHSKDFASYPPRITRDTACIFLSQSGKTRDTMEAIKLCMEKGAYIIGITNLKNGEKGTFYDLEEYGRGNLLRTHTTIYPEKSLPSTQTFHASLALLNDLLIRTLTHDGKEPPGLLQGMHRIHKYVSELSRSKKVIDWAKNLSMNMKVHFGKCFYFVGDGPRYGIAKKQAYIMFMEGVKQDASAVRTGDFMHSLVELLEKDNTSKKPMFLLEPPLGSPNSLLVERIAKMWEDLAGEEFLVKVNPFEHLKDKPDEAMDLLSPQLYMVPLEWFTYYYALLRGVDPGQCRVVKKVRDKKF